MAPNLLLALLLVAAQSVAAMHDIEHDTGTPQNQVCTTCVAASQLGAACVDHVDDNPVESFHTRFSLPAEPAFHSTHALVARQRGPPRPL